MELKLKSRFLLLLLVGCCQETPCNFKCDKTETYTYMAPVTIGKITTMQPRTGTRCKSGHYEQNPKSEWKCAGKK